MKLEILSEHEINDLTHCNAVVVSIGTIKLALQAQARLTARQIVGSGAEIYLEGYGQVIQFPEGFWQALKELAE